MQYQFSCAPKLARKCEVEHWFPCGADGRAVYGHVITKFSGMGRVTQLWGSARARFACVELRYEVTFTSLTKQTVKKEFSIFLTSGFKNSKQSHVLIKDK